MCVGILLEAGSRNAAGGYNSYRGEAEVAILRPSDAVLRLLIV